MKKILILANKDGGLYHFRKDLILELINNNYEIYFSVPNGEYVKKIEKLGCKFIDTPIDRRGTNPISDFKLLLTYKKLMNQIKPDIVLTYTIKPNIYGGMACRFTKTKYFVNITGLGTAFQGNGIGRKLISLLYKIALKKTNTVFFENTGNKDIFVNDKIISNEKCVVLNGAGVNLKEYPFTNFPFENEDIHFLFIGRIMKEKGIDELFEVAKKIKIKYPNVYFDIVGSFEDNYKNIVDELSSKKIIFYHGYQSDVKPFIKKANCFILPSYHEGMANTLLESAAIGRPLITSNINGCKEAVIEGENGFLCDVKSVDSLFEKCIEFINTPYDKKVKMGIKSREHIENVFDKKMVVKKTIDEIIKQKI